jgi:hypothetical protein
MYTLMNPRRLAMVVVVMVGTLVGSWATASPNPPTTHVASSTRHCANTLCTNWLWLRAPVLRVRSL